MVLFFCYSVISIVCDFYFFFAYRSSTKWYTFLWCMDILLVTISIYVYIFLWIDRALQKLEKKGGKKLDHIHCIPIFVFNMGDISIPLLHIFAFQLAIFLLFGILVRWFQRLSGPLNQSHRPTQQRQHIQSFFFMLRILFKTGKKNILTCTKAYSV